MKAVTVILIFLFFMGVAVFIPAYLFMIAWNFVLVSLFGFPALTYWYSFALVFILQMIGGFFRRQSKE